MRQILKKFLSCHWVPGRPLLLACSGGPDSKALLYLLIEAKQFFNLDLHVAHIDHGWREESGTEAEALKKEVERLGLTFHLKKMENVEQKEGTARAGRYVALTEIAQYIDAQAVLLAHQMEDQAETVLKRIFEGATLSSCRGMKEVSCNEKLVLWRPLLSVSKKELMEWLQNLNISYFTDPTNLDPKYLRGRLRTSIFPFLEKEFGKSIVKNLCLLGKRAEKLEEHLIRSAQSIDYDDFVLEYVLKSRNPSASREEIAIILKKMQDRRVCCITKEQKKQDTQDWLGRHDTQDD